ncbi:MAG: site-specific DNA-methyltransferase [Deltaproteobacteria bacterium]|nr:site-specific DNA-methyltransferase [Deltaproteobacteria bacterium]
MEISFIAPPEGNEDVIPDQKEHFQLPTRFGAVPVDEAPLGWEIETRRREVKVTKFQHAYPTIRLPLQEVKRVEFGHGEAFLAENEKDNKLKALFPTGANRLFFGDNLHIMRQLPSESIDLIYIDPPFFSGRNYNVIFGDKNEVRSFSDIWEGGMPGYLVWLNARLWEMKRLLKPTGSIYVHLDWHAVHYVKVEMDKIFGADNFRNEIIWHYSGWNKQLNDHVERRHDSLLFYAKGKGNYFTYPKRPWESKEEYVKKRKQKVHVDEQGREYVLSDAGGGQRVRRFIEEAMAYGSPLDDVWDIDKINNSDRLERIGYPTQKPEVLLEGILKMSSNEGNVIDDFFCGGGTTPAVAQRLNRRWIACDQSRIAVAITADRIAKIMQQKDDLFLPVPDFTVEHWGIYEAPKLEQYSIEQFREFVVKAFGGRPESASDAIHGMRYGVPLYVGEPSRKSRICRDDVARFAKAVYEERRANHGVMLGWNFGPDARKAAEILAARENRRIDFVRLNLIRLEDEAFREHVVTKNRDYAPLLSFIQPPEVRIAVRRVSPLTYEFDVSESVSLNKDGLIANVQWDFSHKAGRFNSTQGYTFLRDKKTGRPLLAVQYAFPKAGAHTIACSVQDDQGGERTVVQPIEVT